MHRSDHQRAQLWCPLEKIFLAGSDRKKRLSTKMATALGEPKGKRPQAGDAKSPTRLNGRPQPLGPNGKGRHLRAWANGPETGISVTVTWMWNNPVHILFFKNISFTRGGNS